MFKVQSSKLIEIEHLSAGYEGKEVLNDINLTVCKDDYLGIIGPNGGGKTTLMRLILGLMKPTDGSIRFYKDGEEVREISMGYLPQYNHLDKQFPISVYEVVLSGLSKTKSLFSRCHRNLRPSHDPHVISNRHRTESLFSRRSRCACRN